MSLTDSDYATVT
jgi:hypothetical protein